MSASDTKRPIRHRGSSFASPLQPGLGPYPAATAHEHTTGGLKMVVRCKKSTRGIRNWFPHACRTPPHVSPCLCRTPPHAGQSSCLSPPHAWEILPDAWTKSGHHPPLYPENSPSHKNVNYPQYLACSPRINPSALPPPAAQPAIIDVHNSSVLVPHVASGCHDGAQLPWFVSGGVWQRLGLRLPGSGKPEGSRLVACGLPHTRTKSGSVTGGGVRKVGLGGCGKGCAEAGFGVLEIKILSCGREIWGWLIT